MSGTVRRSGWCDVVEAEAALDAEPVLVGRPVAAVDVKELVVLDVVGELAADAAIGADAVDLAVGRVGIDAGVVEHRRRHQRAGRAGLDAFAAGDAGAARPSGRRNRTRSSRARPRAAMPMTSLTCTSRQARTQSVHSMQASRLTAIAGWLRSGAGCVRARRKAALGDADPVGPAPEARIRIVRGRARRLVGDQQLEHHLAREAGALAGGLRPSCPARACGCRRRRARARPRSRPCRRGNCRRRDSRARAASTDAGSRRRGGSPPARSSRPAPLRPRPRRG